MVLFDTIDSSLYIFAPQTMMSQVCGLCGNFDGNSANDFMLVTGETAKNYADFVNAWADPTETRELEPVEYITSHSCSLVSMDEVG
jgi:hypothetical protein